jgi:E3 ubiquitin-protein ligase SHPRH
MRTDKIQQLHTLHNLDEILSLGIGGIGRTLRDHQLKRQCKDMREEYLAKAAANVVAADEALEPVQANIRDLSAQVSVPPFHWKVAVLAE